MTEHTFDGEWEVVNGDLRRIKIPGGWIAMTTVKVLIGGRDYHAVSQPILIPDPYYDWRIVKK